MVSPLDIAWDVAKGELFHPSVAGYMAQASDPQFPARRMQRPMADRLNARNAPFRVLTGGQGPIMSPTGEFDHFSNRRRGQRFRPLPRHSSGLPIAESTDHEQQIQLHGSPRDYGIIDHMHPQEHKDFTEQDMGATGRLNPLMLRSSDSPIDTAWSILKELDRYDLEEASRTGGIERLGLDTMRPEISSLNMGAIAPLTHVLPTEPRFSGPRTEQADIQQQYNEAMFPDEEAEHRRINSPTPVSTPGVGDPNRRFLEQRLQDMNYEIAQMNAAGMDPRTDLQLRNLMQERMKLMHRIGQRPAPIPGVPLPIEESGDASMPDPSQMEHLGAQLAHADMMRDDLNPSPNQAIRPGQPADAGFVRHRQGNLLNRMMDGEPLSIEELMYLQRLD